MTDEKAVPCTTTIGISGLIGAGKSTLAKRLATALGLPVYYEPVKENPYLKAFYANMSKHALPMQFWLLRKRYEQQQEMHFSKRGGVQDRTLYEDLVFAEILRDDGHMSDLDLQTYRDFVSTMRLSMANISLVVHLEVSPETALARIKKRGRAFEQGITLDYLRKLDAGYKRHIVQMSKTINVLVVDNEKFVDVGDVVKVICAELKRPGSIRRAAAPKAEKV